MPTDNRLLGVYLKKAADRADELQVTSNNMQRLSDVFQDEGLAELAMQATKLAEAYRAAAQHIRRTVAELGGAGNVPAGVRKWTVG